MIISKPSNFSLRSSSLPPYSKTNPRKLEFFPLRPSLSNKFSFFSSFPIDRYNSYNQNSRYNPWRNRIREEHEQEERQVHCEVDVISWRERRIRAWVLVYAHVDLVWNVLTDYERLADFVPNLVSSGTMPCPHPGRIWVEQRGLQRALYWHIEARVVLDLQEFPNLSNGRELHFSMVDGDFKKFEGKWSLKAGLRSSTTTLSYELNVIPRFNFPAIFIERIIRSDLPVNLRAVAFRAEGNQKTLRFESVVHPTPNAAYASSCMNLSGALSPTDKLPSNELKEHYSSSNLGPLSTSYSSELNNNWGLYGKVCRLDKRCMVDEVHLRRYDGLLEDGGVHRFVVASITVKAPVREVWDILTAYETLPEFVPNLAISKILSRENNKVRILQEGCKGLLYMVLHARVVLDLCEQRDHEISFEQVEGDFDSFQGKWLLEQLGNHHTLLKYIVESKLQKDSILAEAIVEEVIYEDLPSNLCAIRDFVEKQKVVGSNYLGKHNHVKYPDELIASSDNNKHFEQTKPPEQVYSSDGSNPSRKRPKVPGLQRDIEVLKAELLTFISKYGQEGFMPMRKQLRLHDRLDIEKAITRMGGFRKIASLMNLSLAYKHRKPKGYWDNLENLQEEINRFQRSWGMDLTYMPSRKSFERAGRYDIARALEKWGGLHEVSRMLSLKLRHPSRQANLAKDKKIDGSVADVGDDRDNTYSDKPRVSEDIQKWLSQLNQLDINWVE